MTPTAKPVKSVLGRDCEEFEFRMAGSTHKGWKKYLLRGEADFGNAAATELVERSWRALHDNDIRLFVGASVFRIGPNQYADSWGHVEFDPAEGPPPPDPSPGPPTCSQIFVGDSMSRLTWDDLLIQDITADQFRDWISPWTRVVTGRVAPAFMTKFGSWLLRRPEGHVEMLDVLTGQIEQIADTYDDFVRSVNEQWWHETFLLSKLIFELHAAGKFPGPEQCDAPVPHPASGGANPNNGDTIDPRFVMITDIPVWQSICAQSLGMGR